MVDKIIYTIKGRSDIDPESLAGKLSLLLFDKIVLGAVIAFAFVIYDGWKTADQRTYEDKVTLAFQRANYVKELVPIVADVNKDVVVRAQALTALIETRSIGDKSAFALSERLLEANLIRSDYPKNLHWERQHPLLDALLLRMPAGLEALVEHLYTRISIVGDHKSARSAGRSDDSQRHLDDDVDAFWSELFYRALERNKDGALQLLDDDRFLSEYLWIMETFIALVEGETRQTRQHLGSAWFTRKSKGLRLLAALRDVGDVGRAQHAAALEYILDLISPTNMTASNLRLAAELIGILEGKRWLTKSLATRCVQLMLRADADMKVQSQAFDRGVSCVHYVESYALRGSPDPNAEGDDSDGWKAIEPVIVAALNSYLAKIADESIDASDYGSNIEQFPKQFVRNGQNVKKLLIARPLAEILVYGILDHKKPSKATRQVLSKAFSLSHTKVRALILEDLRPRWIQAQEQEMAPE